MNSEEHQKSQRMVDSVIQTVAKDYEIRTARKLTTAEQQCLAKIQLTSQEVRRAFLGRIKLLPLRPNKEQAFAEIAQLWRENLKDWTKDDLLYALSLANAKINIDDIRDEIV